jgi:hypothetical protein
MQNDLYVRVCLEFRRNWFYLSFDEIKFDFITYMFYNWINNVLFNGYQLLVFNLLSSWKFKKIDFVFWSWYLYIYKESKLL